MIKRFFNYFVFGFFCLFAIPLVTHASCDYQRVSELSKEASNVQFNYYYDFKGQSIIFSFTINNVTNDIYVQDNYANVYTAFDNVMQVPSGAKLKLDIYSRDPNCYGEKLMTKYFKIPYYNVYALSDICDNNSNNLCNIWTDVSGMSYAEFYAAVSETQDDINVNHSEKDDNMDFNIAVVTLGIIVGVLVIVMFMSLIKSFRKKRYL